MIGRSYGKITYNDKTKKQECRAFAQEIYDAMVARSAHVLIERLTGNSIAFDDPLVSAITHGKTKVGDLNISLVPNLPIVAVGGPAPVFYGSVGDRLGITPIIPKGSEVANAIGAAIGMVKVRAVVEISSGDSGTFNIHHDGEPIKVTSPTEAIEKAKALAEELATKKAEALDAINLVTDVSVERLDIPGMERDLGLISATITAECLGSPR